MDIGSGTGRRWFGLHLGSGYISSYCDRENGEWVYTSSSMFVAAWFSYVVFLLSPLVAVSLQTKPVPRLSVSHSKLLAARISQVIWFISQTAPKLFCTTISLRSYSSPKILFVASHFLSLNHHDFSNKNLVNTRDRKSVV